MWDSVESTPDRSLIQQTQCAVRTNLAIFDGLGPGRLTRIEADCHFRLFFVSNAIQISERSDVKAQTKSVRLCSQMSAINRLSFL